MQSRVLARVVTEAFAPAVLVAGMTVVIGWRSTGWHWAGLAWGLAASLFTSVVPFGYVLRAVRAGRLRDHRIGTVSSVADRCGSGSPRSCSA